MPYGMKGGDTPENTKWMEKCVSDIRGTNKKTGKPYTEGEKIAICKAQYEKSKGASFETLDEESVAAVENTMEQCMKRMMNSGKAKDAGEAKGMCENMLKKANYEYRVLEFIFHRELP